MSVLKLRFIFKNALFALFIMLLVVIPTWSPALAIELGEEGETTSPQDEQPPEQPTQPKEEQPSEQPAKEESPSEQPPANNQPLCFFFTETGSGQGGFSVTDEGGIKLASAFQQWGLIKIGYPISHRYERDGFVTQAFQKTIMQWRPDSNSVALVNIFDDLHNAGYDDTLEATRQVPQQLPPGWDGDLDFQGVVKKRQALLAVRPALSKSYFASGNPLTFYGLPTSEVKDMDSHFAIRLQRAVLQEWKLDVPWAKKGEVTIANGGDITKELGALSREVTVPIQNGPCPRTTSAPIGTSNQNNSAPAEEAPAPAAPAPAAPAPAAPAPATPAPATPAPATPAPATPAPATPAPANNEGNSPPAQEGSGESTPAPTPQPPGSQPAAPVCSTDLALVQIENGLAEPLTVHLTGPDKGTVTIPPNGSVNSCFERGYYQFSTEAKAIRSISGEKALFSAGCECWRLLFLFPWAEPCTCSPDPKNYTPLQ